jgi:hypothetical protein
MKISFFILLFIGFVCSVYGQINMGSETAKRLKSKELIVIKTGNDTLDRLFLSAAEYKWKFNDQIQLADWKSSEEMVKENPNTYVRIKLQLIQGVMVTTMKDAAGFTSKVSEQNYGDMMKILYFEDSPNRVFETSLPSNLELSEGVLVEAVQRGCNIIDNISALGSWNKFFLGTKKSGKGQLKELTLLIPNELVDSEEDKAEIQKNYTYKLEFVPLSEVHDKIKNEDSNYAYVIIGEEAVSVHVVYICTTKNSQTLCHEHKMVQTANRLAKGGRYASLDAKIFKKLVSGIEKN